MISSLRLVVPWSVLLTLLACLPAHTAEKSDSGGLQYPWARFGESEPTMKRINQRYIVGVLGTAGTEKEESVAVLDDIRSFGPETSPWLAMRLYGGRAQMSREECGPLAKTLQRLLNEPRDVLLPSGGRTWPSLRTETDRLFAALPAAGRDAYRQTHDPDAAALLRAARADKTEAGFVPIVRRYLYTDSGPDAVLGLATRAVEEGDVYRAAAAFALLERHRGLVRWVPEELFLADRAHRAAGNPDAGRAVENELLGRVGPDGIRLNKQIYTRESLQKELERLSPPPREAWLLYGGDAGRGGRAAASRKC
jgi:hypothetical protein